MHNVCAHQCLQASKQGRIHGRKVKYRNKGPRQKKKCDKGDNPHRDSLLLSLSSNFMHVLCHVFHMGSRDLSPFRKTFAGLHAPVFEDAVELRLYVSNTHKH